MTPERRQRIEQMYQGARARDLSQRDAYIDEMCGEDLDLRSEVATLFRRARDLSVVFNWPQLMGSTTQH